MTEDLILRFNLRKDDFVCVLQNHSNNAVILVWDESRHKNDVGYHLDIYPKNGKKEQYKIYGKNIIKGEKIKICTEELKNNLNFLLGHCGYKDIKLPPKGLNKKILDFENVAIKSLNTGIDYGKRHGYISYGADLILKDSIEIRHIKGNKNETPRKQK